MLTMIYILFSKWIKFDGFQLKESRKTFYEILIVINNLFYVVEPFHDSIQSKVRGSNPSPSNTIATYLKNDSPVNQIFCPLFVRKMFQYWIILNDSPENQFPDADFASWYSNVQGKAYSLMQHFVKKVYFRK